MIPVQRLIHHIHMIIFGQKPGQTIYQRDTLEQVGLDQNLSILLQISIGLIDFELMLQK